MLVRWNPWMEIGTLHREINNLLEETKAPSRLFERGFHKVPAAEISETDDAVNVKLEIPGMDTKDLDIQVTEDTVYITGERKSETKTENKGVSKSEFYYGKFQRAISLPTLVQNNQVSAEYKDGILHLTLPKAEEEKKKVVKVNLQ